MKWANLEVVTMLLSAKNLRRWMKKSRPGTSVLGFFFLKLARRIRALNFRSELRSEKFLREAGICRQCWHHTGCSMARASGLMILLSLWSFLCWPTAQAAVDPEQAARAIVAEAANQPYLGKVALAEAIRNRGTLSGVCGLSRADFISSQWKYAGKDAKRAWHDSAKSNLVKGADHWENVKAFGMPSWARDMIKTAEVGDHVFFRSKKARGL